jgi:hypothetical protein
MSCERTSNSDLMVSRHSERRACEGCWEGPWAGGTVGWRLLCCIKEVGDVREWWERRGGKTDGVNGGGGHDGRMREESAKESAERRLRAGLRQGLRRCFFPHHFPPVSPFRVDHNLDETT